ncbi:putative protein OS=Sphingobium scionense OX=1404341 GN=GGQ90_002758 PE=4 SV=1 [Sphingobium scionense]|jgi:hypothetical protein|uniref:Uncharacterized protein n=1 Tax=Sphingobium scionense TaxID=1404341 RepID=A0A7W6LSP6_9SPHN|nr:hypothetical protein [Sphingobium scionense]
MLAPVALYPGKHATQRNLGTAKQNLVEHRTLSYK